MVVPIDSDDGPLHAWLRTNGAKITTTIGVREHDGLRGAEALAPIRENETLASVPSSLMLCESDLLRVVAAPPALLDDNTTRHALLELFVAAQRHDASSFWAPYLASVPADFTSWHPLYYTKAKLAQLQQSGLSRVLRCDAMLAETSLLEARSLLSLVDRKVAVDPRVD